MSPDIECPCSRTVRFHDDLRNTRIKCSNCRALLPAVADRPDGGPSEETERPNSQRFNSWSGLDSSLSAGDNRRIGGVSRSSPIIQRTVSRSFQPSREGSIYSRGLPNASLLSQSKCHSRAGSDPHQIDSAFRNSAYRPSTFCSNVGETCRPGWFNLQPGIVLLSENGIGLLFLFLFMVLRHSYPIVQCGNFSVAIGFSGDDSDARSVW